MTPARLSPDGRLMGGQVEARPEPRRGERILEIGPGTGYSAAIVGAGPNRV